MKSPSKGVVLQRFVSPGSSLMGGALAVVALYDPEDLQVRVDVRQENAGKITVGQSVEITTDAEPNRRYKGTVIRVDPLADLRKNTIQAKVKLLEAGARLHPEMICRVRFLSAGKAVAPAAAPGPLAVPAPAVVTDGGKTYVFLVRAGRAVRTEAKLSEERDGRREVLGGLAEGDRVVLSPAGLTDGAEVSETK